MFHYFEQHLTFDLEMGVKRWFHFEMVKIDACRSAIDAWILIKLVLICQMTFFFTPAPLIFLTFSLLSFPIPLSPFPLFSFPASFPVSLLALSFPPLKLTSDILVLGGGEGGEHCTVPLRPVRHGCLMPMLKGFLLTKCSRQMALFIWNQFLYLRGVSG